MSARKRLGRAGLSDALRKAVPIQKAEADQLVANILQHICQALHQGEKVTISNFGKFEVREKAERMGRNPKTGESAIIPARRVLAFKASRKFRRAVGQNLPE